MINKKFKDLTDDDYQFVPAEKPIGQKKKPTVSRIAEIIKSKKVPGTIKPTSLHGNDHTCME